MARNTFRVKARISAEDQTGPGTRSAEGRFRRFGSFLRDRFVLDLQSVSQAVQAIFRQIEESATLESQTEALRRNLAAQGQDFDTFIAKLREVSDSQISTAKLIESSSQALLLGIPAQEIASLLDVARVSAIATGTSIAQAFEDISVGVGRVSPQILDNLGLVLKLGPAYEAMASELGKNVEELTAAEQKQAILNDVLRVGAERVQTFGDAQGEASRRLSQGTAALDDFLTGVGNVATVLGTATAAVLSFVGSGLALLGRAYAEITAAAAGFSIALGIQEERMEEIRNGAQATARGFQRMATEARSLSSSLLDSALSSAKVSLGLAEAADTAGATAANLDAAAAAADRFSASTSGAASDAERFARSLGLISSAEIERKIREITEGLDKQRESLGANSDEFVRLEQVATAELEKLEAQLVKVQDGAAGLKDEVAGAASAFDSFGSSAGEGTRRLLDFERATDSSTRALERQRQAAESAGRALASAGGGALLEGETTGFQFQGGKFIFQDGRRVRVLPDGRTVPA